MKTITYIVTLCLHKQKKKITFNIEFTIPLKLKHQ